MVALPSNSADPTQLWAFLSQLEDGLDADTLTAVSALTVDGTWDADAATAVNSIRVTLNEVVTILIAMGAAAT
jgi:ABC-type uncharacterized transport system permease subunit